MDRSARKLFRFYFSSLLLLLLVALTFKLTFLYQNRNLFPVFSTGKIFTTFVWGLRFDLAICAPLSVLPTLLAWILLRTGRQINIGVLLLPSLILLSSLHSADLMYFDESGRHLSYEVQDAVGDMGSLIGTGITRYGGTMSLGLSIMLLGTFFSFRLHKNPGPITTGTKPGKRLEMTVLGLLLFTVIVLRGGFQSIPLASLHAYQAGDPKLGVFILNGAYSAMRSGFSSKKVRRVHLPLVADLPLDEKKAVLQSLYPADELPVEIKQVKASDQPNLVVILLEGWAAVGMASYGHSRSTTPFFDRLRANALTTDDMIAGGHRTTEGMFSTFCSSQNPLGNTIANSHLQDFHYDCLPEMLRTRGWATAFFQGTHKETSGTGAFSQKLGFEQSFGKKDMPKGRFPHNYWGAQDPDLYDFVLTQLQKMDKPFFVGINTNTTHDIVLPPGVTAKFGLSNEVAKKESVLYFSDEALSVFMDAYKHSHFGQTLFVIVADHTSGPQPTRLDHYRLPFLIYQSENPLLTGVHLPVTASQRDIAPTVLDLMDLESPSGFLGKSLLKSSARRLADYYQDGILGWIEGRRSVEISVSNGEIIDCRERAEEWELVPCKAQDEDLRLNALVFTDYNQSLLFDGKLNTFADLQ